MVVLVYSCPSLANCSWQGRRDEIVDHFRTKHVELLLTENEFRLAVPSFDINELNRPCTVTFEYAINYLLCDQDEVYLVQVNVVNGLATIQIRYSGSAIEASKKKYSIEVRSKEMVQFSNGQSSTFYSAVKNQPGMINIDAKFLRKAWKVNDFLLCRIFFEEAPSVSKPEVVPTKRPMLYMSKSLEDFSLLKEVLEENKPDDQQEEIVVKRKKDGASLIRSASEQTHSRPDRKSIFRSSKIFKRKSIYKSDTSLFYTNEDFLDGSEDVDELIDLAEDRISLLKDYRCNRCEIYIVGPIYRCDNNHSVCHPCMEENGTCSDSCLAPLSTDQRSPLLEKTRDFTKLPCRFEGCSVSALGAELQQHQVQCNHCVYMCPECSSCIGKYGDVEKHFRIVHPSVKRLTILEFPIPAKSSLLVIHPQGVFYCSSSEKDDNVVDWKVEHCGHVNIYFECLISLKKTSFPLTPVKNEKNILKVSRSMSIKEKKQKSGAFLKIIVYQPHV